MPNTSTTPVTATRVTIHDLIAVVPDDLTHDTLHSPRALRETLDTDGVPAPRFLTRAARPWRRHLFIDLRPGRPSWCAGGPIRLLDLDATRHAAGLGAAVRHHTFTHVVRGTRPATSWPEYLQKHLEQPTKHPLEKVRMAFDSQPRVLALNAHNANHPHARLDPMELEMFQAGPAGYANYHALAAVCGDAVLTSATHKIAPGSDRMADRVAYLTEAHQYLTLLQPTQRLLAIRL